MKKLVLVLVVLSLFVGCSNPVSESDNQVKSPFEGTWRRTGIGMNNVLQFTDDKFTFTWDTDGWGKGSFSGVFTYTETTITFIPLDGLDDDEEPYSVYWTQDYIFDVYNGKEYIDISLGSQDGIFRITGGDYFKE